MCVSEGVETQTCCYLQLVDHLVKQFSSFGAVGVLKVVFDTNLNHDGLQVAANAYVSGRRSQAALIIWVSERGVS